MEAARCIDAAGPVALLLILVALVTFILLRLVLLPENRWDVVVTLCIAVKFS
jgi:hypothetical protein